MLNQVMQTEGDEPHGLTEKNERRETASRNRYDTRWNSCI